MIHQSGRVSYPMGATIVAPRRQSDTSAVMRYGVIPFVSCYAAYNKTTEVRTFQS